jgi:hypothetical protein
LVSRENRGTSVYYSIADRSVYELCDLVCGSIAQQFEQQQALRLPFLKAMGQATAPRAKQTKSKIASLSKS